MKGNKLDRLNASIGNKMAESIGAIPAIQDRFRQFKPSMLSGGEMALTEIIEDTSQPRQTYNQESLVELAESIKVHGVSNPIQLRWNDKEGKWMIVSGHRRFRASKLAGITNIPCTFCDENLDESIIRQLQIIENLQREDLTPIETAKAIKNLIDETGLSHREIGKQIGKGHATVGRYLKLLELPHEVQAQVNEKELSVSVAAEISKLRTPTVQKKVSRKMASKGLNRTAAVKEISIQENDHKDDFAIADQKEMVVFYENDFVKIFLRADVNKSELKKSLLKIAKRIS